jgi:hypothetical protein
MKCFQVTGIKLITENKEEDAFNAWAEIKKRLNEAGFAVVGKNIQVTVVEEKKEERR